MSNLTLGSIGQAASDIPSANFTKIEVKSMAGMQTLWENGVSYSIEVPSGYTWEVRCHYNFYCQTGGYAIFVSENAFNVPSAYSKQCLGDRYETGGAWYSDYKDFEMGTMPGAAVTINHIKLWTCNAYTVQKPPQSEW